MAARVFDRLSPRWAVVGLLVGLTLPQSLLALPIAAADVGVWPALGLLAVIGTLMALCIAGEAEALSRDGDFLRKGGFFGKFIEHYLGSAAATIPTALAALRTGMSVLAGYVGICTTLAELTDLSRPLWGALTIVALALALARGGVRTPAAVGALIGLGCLPLLAAIAAIALGHGGSLQLPPTPAFSGSALGGLVGLVLILYMGSVYVVQVAREALPADPDGRALISGSAIATLATTAIAAAWLLATSAVLPPSRLSSEVGTVLGPLAAQSGAAVTVLGALLTILLLGLGTERAAVALLDLVEERLPGRRLLPAAVPLAVCLVGEGLLDLGAVSFSGIFNAAGIAANVVLGLALPGLLLAAARASGDIEPGLRVPLLGRRAFLAALLIADALLLIALATVLADGALVRVLAPAALGALVALVWLATPRRRRGCG
ncbi:MAG TPA: hypothetical protein VGH14_18275 [Solirubrobacterales bacterium]